MARISTVPPASPGTRARRPERSPLELVPEVEVHRTADAVGSLTTQSSKAEVTGVVRDSVSRPLAEVDIRAADLETGLEYRAVTSTTGRYWLRGLPPGRYDVTAARIGLRSTTVRGLRLAVGRTVGIDFVMRPSAVELQPLVVDPGGTRVETTRPEVSYVLDRERIQRLPGESRHFIELVRLVPGATRGTGRAGGPPQFGTDGSSVGALDRQSLGILVDGADFTEGLFGDLGGSLPLLAIREFEVIQGQYSADLGRASSGLVNVVTRRGGNRMGAEGFVLYRHRALNARGPFESRKPAFERWHFGAAAGGPVARDRTHVFAAFERREQSDFSTVHTGGVFPEHEGTFRTPFTDNLLFARLDHRLNDAHDLSFRYSGEIGEKLLGVGGIRSLEQGRNHSLEMHSGLLGHRWSGGGSWLNEARLHIMSHRQELLRNAPPGPTLEYPNLIAGPYPGEERKRSVRLELRDDFSTVQAGRTGSHRLRVGAHLSWLHSEADFPNFHDGYFVFRTNTDPVPVLGQVSFKDAAVRLDADNLQMAVYAQDEWMPTDALTLSLGLRYDVETNGSNQDWVSPFAGQLPFVPTEPRPVDKDNLAPRVGVAWDPGGDGRTVVRAGFGIFYDALMAGPLLALERSTGVPVALIRNPGTTDVDDLVIDPDTVPPFVWTAGTIETPMTRQMSLGLERAFPGDLVVRIDGLFIQGRNLLLQRNLNPFDGSTGTFRFPGFSRATKLLSLGRAEAKMLLVGVRKAFGGGRIDVGYTLADRKNTNDTWGRPRVPQTDLDDLDLDEEWGPAAWDERHRLVATGGIELPGGLELVATTVYSSARPFTALTGRDDNGDFDTENDRPPGEGRNARRGPDFFQTDLSATWDGLRWASLRSRLTVNVYNLFNRTNGVPSSVQNVLGEPLFGQPTAAFPGRQVEVGLRMSAPRPPSGG